MELKIGWSFTSLCHPSAVGDFTVHRVGIIMPKFYIDGRLSR